MSKMDPETGSQTGTYIVSGAGSGIGQAIATKIVAQGHQVFGLGRDPLKLAATAKALGERFSFVAGDLSSTDDTARVVLAIRECLAGAPLRGLVNNAGVFDRVSFNNSPDALWRRQFENNVLSAVRLTREFFNELHLGAPSSVLNISSTLGLRPVASTSAYAAMKAALVNWTKTLALEWAPFGIRANCLCPGLVDTPIHAFHRESDASSVARQQAHAAQPLGRLGTPQEIAASAWFLLSPESAWTTGAVMSVDGGISL